MIAVDFPERTHLIAENQPEYETLPAHIDVNDPTTPCTMCFELNKEEIEEIVKTGKLYFTQFTFRSAFQPINMSTQNPFIQQSIIQP